MSNQPEGFLQLVARNAWQTVLANGVLALLLGVVVLVWPGATLLVVGVFFGIYLLVSGVLQIAAAFGTHVSTALRVMAFISGVLSIMLGLFCFRDATQSVLLLATWIGIGWLFRGITQTIASASDERMPARGWMMFDGLLGTLAGIALIVSPLSSITGLAVFGGCLLVTLGIVAMVTAFRIRAGAKYVAARR